MSGRRIYLNIQHKIRQCLNPALCLSCGISVSSRHYFCEYCLDAMQRVSNPCTRCGLPQDSPQAVCPACLHKPPRWQLMLAPLSYSDSTRKIIHDLKFNEHIHNANALLTHIEDYFRHQPVDVLIPVPLHKNRLLERGFNQSEEIARILSQRLDIALDRKSLTRVKETRAQSGLSRHKRLQNIRQAFMYNPLKPYRSVAIIDDVITSGSTMTEICRTLNKKGVDYIQVWSLARALKHDQ